MQLYPGGIPLHILDGRNPGPTELLLQPYLPLRFSTPTAHSVPRPLPPGAPKIPPAYSYNGIIPASWRQILGVEGAGRSNSTPHLRTQDSMDVQRFHPHNWTRASLRWRPNHNRN